MGGALTPAEHSCWLVRGRPLMGLGPSFCLVGPPGTPSPAVLPTQRGTETLGDCTGFSLLKGSDEHCWVGTRATGMNARRVNRY